MPDPTFDPLNQNNPIPTSIPAPITTPTPTQVEPSVEQTMPTVEQTAQVAEPQVYEQPASIEELTGLQNKSAPTFMPASTTSSTNSGKILKIVIPAAVAVALGIGGYLVYALFIKSEPVIEEPAAITEEQTVTTDQTPTSESSSELEQSIIQGLETQTDSTTPVDEFATDIPADTSVDTSTTEEPTTTEEPATETPTQKVPRI